MRIDPDEVAAVLLKAMDTRTAIRPIMTDGEPLTLDEAYAVQAALCDLRTARGEKIIGAKVGLTSRAKQVQMGVDTPIFGFLTDTMQLGVEAPVPLDALIHPRCEPELVFGIGTELRGPGVTAQDVLDATAWVAGGIEVIDSRYEKFSFKLPDVVADNTSAARFVVGTQRIPAAQTDLALLGCLFEVDGELAGTAAGAALMGHPAECVAMLANHLSRRRQRLEKGWIVLAGGLTAATPLAPGTSVAATYAHLGRVGLRAQAGAS